MQAPRDLHSLRQWLSGHKGLVGDLRGLSVSSVLTLATTVSYATVAAGFLSAGEAGLAASMVLSGLIAASLGALVASAMGSAATLIFSPRASVSVIIAAAAVSFGARQGVPIQQVIGLLTLCLFLSALMQLAFAALRLGGLIRLIPHSVTAGLVVALSLKLAWSQLPGLIESQGNWLAPALTGLATLASIALFRRRRGAGVAMLGGLMVGLLVGGLVSWALPGSVVHLPAIDLHLGPLLSSREALGLWGADIPLQRWSSMLGFAAVIALVNSFETLTSALQVEEMGGRRVDANRTLMASACGSLMSLCAGGLPIAASTSTSAAHVQAGGRSRWAAIASAVLVGAATLLLGSAVSLVPVAVVSGLLLSVAFDLALGPLKEMLHQWRADRRNMRGEIAVAVLVGGLLLAAGILVALAAGVVAASALAFVKMRDGLVRRQYSATGTGEFFEDDEVEDENGIQVIELGQPLFFATVETAITALDKVKPSTRFAVLDLAGGGIDLTAAKALARCAIDFQRDGRQLLLVGGPQATEYDAQLRPCLVFDHLGKALNYCVRQPLPGAGSGRPAPQRSETPREKAARHARELIKDIESLPMPLSTAQVPLHWQRPAAPARPDPRAAALEEEEDFEVPASAWYRPTIGINAPAAFNAAHAAEASPPRPQAAAGSGTRLQAAATGAMRSQAPTTRPVAARPAAARPPAAWQSAAAVETATALLTQYIGPVAGLIVKRSAQSAAQRDQFYLLLAQHIEKRSERDAFLRRLRASFPGEPQ